MKNIHIIQTDKPSRLLKQNNNKLILSKQIVYSHISKHLENINQNIYITNDEEIKEGDWCLFNRFPNVVSKATSNMSSSGSAKKIILTDNTELIKDGVQAIPDEFLEWFVNNPSCEEVNTNKIFEEHGSFDISYYKIIIPKEEILPEQIWNDEKMEGIKKVIQQHKQETLKEDAVKRYPNNGSFTIMDIDYSSDLQLAYIEGFNAHTNNLNIALEELKLLKEELSYEKRKNIK